MGRSEGWRAVELASSEASVIYSLVKRRRFLVSSCAMHAWIQREVQQTITKTVTCPTTMQAVMCLAVDSNHQFASCIRALGPKGKRHVPVCGPRKVLTVPEAALEPSTTRRAPSMHEGPGSGWSEGCEWPQLQHAFAEHLAPSAAPITALTSLQSPQQPRDMPYSTGECAAVSASNENRPSSATDLQWRCQSRPRYSSLQQCRRVRPIASNRNLDFSERQQAHANCCGRRRG